MNKISLTDTIIRRPVAVLAVFLVLFAAAVVMTGFLRFEQDIFKIMPQNTPAFQVLIHAFKTSTAQDKLYLLVTGPSNPDALVDVGNALCRDLEQVRENNMPAFKNVSFHKTGAVGDAEFQLLMRSFFEKPSIFLTAADLPVLACFLKSPKALDEEVRRSLAILAAPGTHALSKTIAVDPLNLRRFAMEKIQTLHQGLAFSPGPYLLSPDKKALLIIATPAVEGHGAASSLMSKIDRIREKYSGTKIGVTGGFAIAAQEESLIRKDILGCLIGSILGVGLLFLLIYRNYVALVFILVPLGVGLQLALGCMSLVFSRIHLLATAFSTVVLGLGIDFAVHVYDRYAMERQSGQTLSCSVKKAVRNTGSAVLAGCLTTLVAFLALSFTQSPILHQIGWLVSLGLLFCLLTILIAVPACLVGLEKRFNRRPHDMKLLGADRLANFIVKQPKSILLVSLVCVLLAIPGIFRLRLETDPKALRPQGLEALDVQEDMITSFGSGSTYVLVSWKAVSGNDFWEKGLKIDGALQRHMEKDFICSWSSLSRITLPRFPGIAEIDLSAIDRVFKPYGLSLSQFPETLNFIEHISEGDHDDDVFSEVEKSDPCKTLNDLPDLFKRFFICEKNQIRGILWVVVPESGHVSMLESELKKDFPDLDIISPGFAVKGLVTGVKKELLTTVTLASVLIIGILLIYFRNLFVLPMVLMPMLMGLVMTTGIMGWTGVHLNPFNFIVLPILIGIGLDDGIHIYRRFQEQGDIRKAVSFTGRSVLVTTLTTICGFGSLSMADYHVLKSMGVMAIVGVVACFLFSVITLPAVLEVRKRQ